MSGRGQRAVVPSQRSEANEAARHWARFEQSPLAQMVHDLDGRVVEANDAMCRLVGKDRRELVGQPTAHLHHTSDPASGIQRAGGLFSGAIDTAQWERVLARADGSPVPTLITASLVRDESGAPDCVHSFLQDLTLLRRAQSSLSRSTARFEALLSEADDWAVVTTADGIILYVSPAFRSAFGHEPSALLGTPGIDLVHPDDVAAMEDAWRRLLDAPAERERLVFRLLAADGRWVWVEEVLTNRLAHLDIAGIVINGRDVTERRAAEQAVHASEARYALDGVATRKLKTYSGGMKRRIGIAQAILNNPRLLIVDEPTAGLDPEERLRFRNLLATLSGDRTVLLSTHIVDDVVQTCPQVIVVAHGAVAYQGTTDDLAGRAQGAVWMVTRPVGRPAPDLPVVAIVPTATAVGYRVICAQPPGAGADPMQPTVEDGYVALMQGVQRD